MKFAKILDRLNSLFHTNGKQRHDKKVLNEAHKRSESVSLISKAKPKSSPKPTTMTYMGKLDDWEPVKSEQKAPSEKTTAHFFITNKEYGLILEDKELKKISDKSINTYKL